MRTRPSSARPIRARPLAVASALALAAAPLIVAATGPTAAATVPGHGSATMPARSWPAQLAHPAAASCPRGQKLIAPTGGWRDALGVAHVTYRAAPGMVSLVPPRGLTAGRVTPALLADLGLPARRQSGPGRNSRPVGQALNLAQHQTAPEFCWSPVIASEATPGGRTAARPSTTDPLNTVYYQHLWSGYVITEAQYGHGINSAKGSWAVPKSGTSSAPSGESTWVGIGGKVGGEGSAWGLIQTGTAMDTDAGYRSWFEYLGSSGPCTDSGPFCGQYSSVNAIHWGDSIFGQVSWNTTTSACFILTDSQHSGGSWDACRSVSIAYDHTSAEWIDERSEGYTYYDNPGTVQWTGQGISTGSEGTGPWNSPFSYPKNAYVMGTSGPPSCSSSGVVSYPADSATKSGLGTSETITCVVSGVDYP